MWVFRVSWGRGWNSSHVQRAAGRSALRRRKSQVATGVRGVGPAESRGKAGVSYWPGGSRAAVAPGRGRPRNPREINGSVMALRTPPSDAATFNVLAVANTTETINVMANLQHRSTNSRSRSNPELRRLTHGPSHSVH